MRLEKNVCKSIPPFLSWNLSKYESFKTKPPTLSFQRFCKLRSHGKPDRSPTSTDKIGGFGDYTITEIRFQDVFFILCGIFSFLINAEAR